MLKPLTPAALDALEFERVRGLLHAYAGSPLGRDRIARLAPTADREWIALQQRLTEDVREYLRAGGRFEFAGLADVGRLLDKSRIQGAALESAEIREILALADRAAEWREIALHPPEGVRDRWQALPELSAQIADFTELLRFFRNKFDADGRLEDRASPELARLRRDIERQKRDIQSTLHSYVRRLAGEGAVQEELVTIRGERFVIPVKTEHKRRITGVVHGASSSGQTVFVEPLETIEQNNELVRLLEEEQAEVFRILQEMTRRIAENAVDIAAAQEAVAELELQFAKARYAEDYECAMPALSDSGLELRRARHPLLEQQMRASGGSVVPLNLELRGGDHQLVISGPNTGGKSVALKTVGLLAAMAQSGIPVPAEKAELPVFDGIFADIGDYQSIERNLSTFSAHVTNINAISAAATAGSLVLLDELGSATDPEEGAALAVAIAEHFLRSGALTLISTHHTSLKIYAENTPGVVNAAVGFDERTFRPTYELRVGVPGASAGINIAQRLGLRKEIVEAARNRVSSQAQDVARFLDRLHEELRLAAQQRAELAAREQQLARERERLERSGEQEQRLKVRELERKLEALFRDFEYEARKAVEAVQERAAAQKLGKEAERRMAKLRREFKEQFDAGIVAHRSGADQGDPNARPGLVRHVAEGDTVRLKSLGRPAVIRKRLGDDLFEAEAGIMKMKVRLEDIAEVLESSEKSQGMTPVQAARSRGISVQVQEGAAVPMELNVIGRNVDDASREVERFVDRAFLAGMPRVRIVHGSGMGILRKALRQLLREHPHVAGVTEPPQNEGGAGATVVELRT